MQAYIYVCFTFYQFYVQSLVDTTYLVDTIKEYL